MKHLKYIILILVGTASHAFAQTPHLNPTSFLLIDPGSGNQLTLSPGTLTGNRIFTFPDASGTLAVSGNVVISTNSTFSGDGTIGNPLGLNLANANTWTATQTLPVTAAQGDALIASTNAGTTTIDAARIGAGLTDAQVNDNLTINGGTIDATPVGATTPSTGVFTTLTGTTITGTALPSGSTSTDVVVSNGGALETRTFASLGGSIAVSTDGTLTGDGTTGDPLGLNLANANTWTATQTLPTTAAQGDALIASTNAGTTTIDAARIGAGLTDAQVNDNLTINGGTVDATPVGATTPSTGSFTTLDASGTTSLNGATNIGNGDAGDVATVNTGGGTDLVISEDGVDRSSGSAETFAIDNSGAGDASVLVNGATAVTNSRIVVNEGHWTSQGTAPSITTNGVLQSPSASTSSTDVAGQVFATDNTTGGTGVITVTFSSAYTSDPIIVVTPRNAASFNAGFFVSNVTTTSFDIDVITTANDGTTTYTYTYQVIEND